MGKIKMVKIDSANIIRFGYDEDNQEIHIETEVSEYYYEDVPKSVYEKLLKAPSKGSFIWRYLEGSYKCISKPSLAQLKELSMPIVDYLNKYYNPHTKIVISNNFIEVLQEEMGIPVSTR